MQECAEIRFVKVVNPCIYRQLNLKKLYKEYLFNESKMQEIHARRVDYKETFAKRYFTRNTCSFSIWQDRVYNTCFLKFGCLLFLDSANFIRMKLLDFDDFVEKLRVEFLECHFHKLDTYDLIEAYKEEYYKVRRQIAESDEGAKFLYQINKGA